MATTLNLLASTEGGGDGLMHLSTSLLYTNYEVMAVQLPDSVLQVTGRFGNMPVACLQNNGEIQLDVISATNTDTNCARIQLMYQNA